MNRILGLFKGVKLTRHTAAPITIGGWIIQRILGRSRDAYWPTHFSSKVAAPRRIFIGIGCAPGLSPGCYIQGNNGIEIGDYTIIAANVGIISANHSIYDLTVHEKEKPIWIGAYCWIGMNAVLLPGVRIGNHTIVAAGAVVTKSFEEGFCVLGGNPAKVIRTLEKTRVVEKRNQHEYIGFYPVGCRTKLQVYEVLGLDLAHFQETS